ncbi:MAG: hypothetical protein AB1304_06245 [Bacteroidota bacterium]
MATQIYGIDGEHYKRGHNKIDEIKDVVSHLIIIYYAYNTRLMVRGNVDKEFKGNNDGRRYSTI